MAVAIRGGAPVTTNNNGSSSSLSLTLTGTTQPQVNDIVLIIHCNDFYATSAMPTPTVGGSTTGVTAVTGGTADAGTNEAHVKAYWWLATSAADKTVAVTESAPGDEEKALIAYVLSGADTTTPIDVAGPSSSSTSSGSWVLSAVSPASSNAFLIAHVNTGTGAGGGGSVTPDASMTEIYDVAVGSGFTFEGATQQLSASGSTGTRTFTPASSAPWAGLLIAVNTAAGGGATANPAPPVVSVAAVHRAATY